MNLSWDLISSSIKLENAVLNIYNSGACKKKQGISHTTIILPLHMISTPKI